MCREKKYLKDRKKSTYEDSINLKDTEQYKAIKDELKRKQEKRELMDREKKINEEKQKENITISRHILYNQLLIVFIFTFFF